MITIKNIPERREAVTAINKYDAANGLNPSQKAKYERPLWALVSAVLVGNDRGYSMSQTDIQRKLEDHNIYVTLPAITHALRTMINLDESIHPHRRNCGVSCYEFVKQLRGIKTWWCNTHKGMTLYAFNSPQSKVVRQLRVWGLTIQAKP